MGKIEGKMRRAIQDFNMIQEGDRIAVGLSGGKDSTLLLYMLKKYQNYAPFKFELYAVNIKMGFEREDSLSIIDFCKSIDVPIIVEDTETYRIIFQIRKEKNPCSLCANIRRGALNNIAKSLGCNKVALGHHADDAVETLLLSIFYEGRIRTFSPITYLSNKEIYIIRPFVYENENEIIAKARELNFKVVKNPCPIDGYTKRQYIKDLIKNLEKDTPDIKNIIFHSIKNVEQLEIWDIKKIRDICKK